MQPLAPLTAILVLLGVCSSRVAATGLHLRADPTAPWVSVDREGQPASTYTPSVTTIDGTTSVVNGAPHDITASLYTFTNRGYIIYSTGSPPPPAPTHNSGAGAFARCYNQTGLVCDPPEGSVLNPKRTYYSMCTICLSLQPLACLLTDRSHLGPRLALL